jgi:maleylpyruvate isomerase
VSAARHDIPVTREWMRAGEAFFAGRLATLGDGDLDGPSALPGWERRKLAAHVARNAEALLRLVRWADTGVETRMYGDPDQRGRDIEATSGQSAAELRADVQRAAAELADAMAKLADERWQATVLSALGRTIPAAEVPWMRCREVWLHSLDLAAGATPGDLPLPFAEELVDELAGYMSAQPSAPETELASTADGRRWHIDGPAATGQPLLVRGDPRELAAWLTGRTYDRSALQADDLPQLPNWL